MSDDLDMKGEEIDLLAAEYALGIADDEGLARAGALLADDEDFRRGVARWSGRLAPLLEEVDSISPPPDLWTRIENAIGPRIIALAPEVSSNIHVLRRRVNLWRGYSAVATALAASLALFLVTRPSAEAPTQPSAGAPLVATMEAEGSPAKLVATFDPASRMLLVAPAAGLSAVAGRTHELWLIPADGKPRTMGLLEPGGARRVAIPPAMLAEIKADVTLALSVEPAGGSPTGQPTGPVVAAGKLVRA
ncbi:MAG TPA: anti-sigma factor [Allosphingosinicella sp.]|nr:anti-sigma factor [Allosphingosinicella sp.]